MTDPAARPIQDESADEEPPASLTDRLPDHEDSSSTAGTEEPPTEALDQDEPSPVLEEIEDSPVRTKNS